MAFASSTTKYYHEFEGEDGATYQWQIRERGFSGTALPLTASSLDHCETSWKLEGKDEYGPIMGSETSISFFDNSLNDVLDDLTSGTNFDFNRDYALAITRNGSLQWIGYMETPDVSVDEEGPTRISLTATDGLGRLKKFAYADTDGNPFSGRARLTTIIAELLGPQDDDLSVSRENGVEFGSGFYTACQIYPGTTLSSNDDPLYNIYIDRLGLAASRGKNGDLVAATKLDALKMILSTFGLRISYSEGYYHIYNPHLYHGTSSFNRWAYYSNGSQQSATPSSFTHRVTPANETIERTRGTIRQLQQYNGVSVQHSHEVAVVFQQPDFNPASSTGPGERGRSDALKWIRGNLTNVKLRPGDGEEDFAGFVATVEYGGPPLPSTPSQINSQVGTNYWKQESLTTYRTGDSFDAAWEFKVLPNNSGTSGTASNRNPEFMVALQVRLNATNGDIYYLSFDDSAGTAASWGSANAAAWMVYEADTISSKVGGVISQKFTTSTMPADGTIEIRLGPVIEAAARSDSGGTARRATEGILWDNVQFYAVVGDGEYRNDMTITTNFLEGRRDEENIKVITTQLGDGPNDDSRGSMTYSDDISDRTTDWAVGAHGSATGERIDEVVCRTVLKSTNLPRRLHQASYETIGSILYPQKSINRSGSSYPALSVAIDWRTQSAEGSWYKTSETAFTDDIVTQIESVPRGSTYSGSGTSMLESSTLTRLTKSFFSDEARKIATTSEGIPAGNGTESVNVEEMPEPLLNAGDRIVLIAPDLSFYKLEITQDQPADATELFFADPESTSDPKANFDFPREVLSGASIYVYEEDLLTLVRAGEQGFAVTVLGGNLGLVNQTTSGSLTQLAVDEWVTTIKTGNTVEIQQRSGSFVSVRLTQDAPRGSTTIYFDDPNEIAGTSIALDVKDGDRIAPTGSVGRADFTVTADAITSYISTDGDLIATIAEDADSGFIAQTGTDVTGILKPGDTVYFHRANNGRVFKRTVASVGSPTSNDFGITSEFGGDDIVVAGDYVFGGTLVGMRIDADGVDFVNTHIKSDNWASSGGVIDDNPASATYGEITTNGTEGWAITKSGEAEFNNAIVRGKIDVGGIRIGKDVGYLTGIGDEPTAGEHGIWINADNYWILDTNADPDEEFFRVGDNNSHINWDGTTGSEAFTIKSQGSIVFDSSSGSGGLGLTGKVQISATGSITDGTNYELGSDGLDFQLPSGPSAVTELRWLETLGSTSAGDITLGAWSTSPVGRVIEADADTFRLYTNGTLNTATGDGIWADSARYHGEGIVFGGSASEIVGSSAGLYLKSTSASTSFLWPGNPGNNGDVLTSDGSGGLTFSAAGGGGATSLGSLSDVSITSAATGDLLRYNGSSWVDYPDSNYAAASHTHAATDITSGTLASARLSGSYTGITGVGTLSAGSIATGFGSIATARTISSTSKIYVGGSTYASDGIQLDYNSGNPRFYVGDGANSYFQFDGTTAELNGGLVTNIASGSDIGIQGWSSDIIFSATDVDTVSWTTGTIKLADGTTYSSIGSGNTGNMTALTYIYFDSAQSTILKTTTTATTAVGNGKILIAVAQKNTDTGATEAVFQAFGGRGGQLINAASIAANSITANEIAANTITAGQIVAGTITATELASNSVTATKINVTDLSAVNTSTGSLSVTGDLTMNSYAGSEWASAKITSAGDIFANNGYFESLTAASSGLTVYSSTAGPASGTLAYANGVFTVDGDDVISEGSIGNGLSYTSFTLKADSSVESGTTGYTGDTDTLILKTGDGKTVLILCEDVT